MMKFPLRCLLVAAFSSFVGATPLFAVDPVSVVVANPLPDVTVAAGTTQTKVQIKKTFALGGVTGDLVRFTTNVGTVDVELFTQQTPKTAAIFESYAFAAGENGDSNYTYNNTLIQRAIPGFIVQGGGFYVDSSKQVNQILGRPAIASEAGIANTRGTLAMALSTGPDSGTGDFFFNLSDNANLDISDKSDPQYNGGPFTVFGRVVVGMKTLDKIVALPQQNFSSQLGGSFANVPLVDYDGTQQASVSNLVYLNSVAAVPIVAKKLGEPGVLKVTAKSSNEGLVKVTVSGKKLFLNYVVGKTGTARITVKAKVAGEKIKAESEFNVTVE